MSRERRFAARDSTNQRRVDRGGKWPGCLESSTDPLLALARDADRFAGANEKEFDQKVNSVETAASDKIGRARFAIFGHRAYPDATFTLRLSYGQVNRPSESPALSSLCTRGARRRVALFDSPPDTGTSRSRPDRSECVSSERKPMRGLAGGGSWTS